MDAGTLRRKRLEREHFHALFDLAPEQREAHLEALAREDAALADELRRVLAYADTAVDEADAASPGRRAGSVVSGRFRLLRLLGAGGMGEVYLAERTDDVDKKVALKLVRGDLPLPLERARRERQILARLEHPNIAGLVDAGLTDTGQPWFAMTYVDGAPITTWCDRRALDLRARVRLFARAVEAVQFAHRNLVLHRDLKPSNILVDADGAPKLLDFGIAKLLDATDPQQTQTLALTPAYAAPEQLRGEAATTASDVYQLGLVLYELLGGVSAREAREAARTATRLAVTLPRMDQALAALGQCNRAAAEHIARARRLSIDKLRRALRGDLGRIVSKTTADGAHERYVTAQALADDLQRWADGRPVAAHRGSLGYRLHKLVRRHAAAALLVVALATGLVAVSVIAIQRADTERQQRERAEQQRNRAQTLLAFLRDVFREAEPNRTDGAKLDADELLTRAGARLDQRSDLDAPARAVLLTEVAEVFGALGRRDAALATAERAEAQLEPVRSAHPLDYLRSVEVLMASLRETGRHQNVLDLIARTLPIAATAPDPDRAWYPLWLTYRGSAEHALRDFDAAERDLRAALVDYRERGIAGGDDLTMAINELAHLMHLRGDAGEALRLLRWQSDLVAADPHADKSNALALQQQIAQVELLGRGNVDAALAILKPLPVRFDALLGPAHDRSINTRSLLALAHLDAGDWRQAADVLRIDQALADTPGAPINPTILDLRRLVQAKLAVQLGDTSEALRLTRDADTFSVASTGLWRNWLAGEALLQDGQLEAAQDRLERARRDAQERYGDKPMPLAASIEDAQGRCRLLHGDYAAARTSFERAADGFRAAFGAGKPATLRSEIHALWAEVLQNGRISAFERLRTKRGELVGALGTQEQAQVWQLDLLIDELARSHGWPGIDAAGRANAEANMRALQVRATSMRGGGLASFY